MELDLRGEDQKKPAISGNTIVINFNDIGEIVHTENNQFSFSSSNILTEFPLVESIFDDLKSSSKGDPITFNYVADPHYSKEGLFKFDLTKVTTDPNYLFELIITDISENTDELRQNRRLQQEEQYKNQLLSNGVPHNNLPKS